MEEDEPCASKRTKRKARELWAELRHMQRATGCTDKILAETFRRVKRFSGIDEKLSAKRAVRSADKCMRRKSGARMIRVDGCAGCDEHVFLPSEHSIFCPKCRHPRYNSKKEPNEVHENVVAVRTHKHKPHH